MIDAVRLAFAAVRGRDAPAGDGLNIVGVETEIRVLVGLDAQRRAHLLLPLSSESAAPDKPKVSALDLQTRPLSIGGFSEAFVDVSCALPSAFDVFEHFVAAVVDRASGPDQDPIAALNAVMASWRDFFRPTAGPPSREKLASLLGELLVLLDVAHENAVGAVEAWMGPSGGRHDFRRGGIAFEVKTTRAHTSRQITVHGEDQLDPPDGGSLHLHFVRLEETPGEGASVTSVVDALLAAGVTAEALYRSLGEAGIAVTELSTLADVRFQTRERFTVPVDAQTPRIIPSSFILGARPLGVLDLNYAIDLDHQVERGLRPADYAALVRRLAGMT